MSERREKGIGYVLLSRTNLYVLRPDANGLPLILVGPSMTSIRSEVPDSTNPLAYQEMKTINSLLFESQNSWTDFRDFSLVTDFVLQ